MQYSAYEVDQSKQTYRYLRLLMPTVAFWLLSAIVVDALVRRKLRGSISDYYNSPLRNVFVGALIAVGVCMIAYKGKSTLEDYALNFAGLNAFFVALVPNSFAKTLKRADVLGEERRSELLTDVKVTVVVLLGVVAIFVSIDFMVMHWTRFELAKQTTAANVLIGTVLTAEAAYLLGIVVPMLCGVTAYGSWPIFSAIHFIAAALLIVGLSVAAASYAIPQLRQDTDAPEESQSSRPVYGVIAVAMLAGIVVGGACIRGGVDGAVFWTEAGEIAIFLIFWVFATRAEWSGD